MATVTRRVKLVNPRRKLTRNQIQYFGTARQRAALKASRKRKRPAVTSSRHSHRPISRRAARPNVSAIVTAGLPFGNPQKRGKTQMAYTTKRRRPRASKTHHKARRHNKKPNPVFSSHRPRTKYRTRTVVKYRYRGRKNPSGRRRHNPVSQGMGTKALLMNSVIATGNAVLSRWLPNYFFGASNTGALGYGANIATGLIGAWAAKKFAGKSAGYAALLGLGISVVLRAANDFTPWGSALALNGFGDSGMGALMPQDFVNPALYTGNGAEVYVPQSFRPIPPSPAPTAAPMHGMGSSTYRSSSYAR